MRTGLMMQAAPVDPARRWRMDFFGYGDEVLVGFRLLQDGIWEVLWADAQGDRRFQSACGCAGSAGGGAYGTFGSLWADYPCWRHG